MYTEGLVIPKWLQVDGFYQTLRHAHGGWLPDEKHTLTQALPHWGGDWKGCARGQSGVGRNDISTQVLWQTKCWLVKILPTPGVNVETLLTGSTFMISTSGPTQFGPKVDAALLFEVGIQGEGLDPRSSPLPVSRLAIYGQAKIFPARPWHAACRQPGTSSGAGACQTLPVPARVGNFQKVTKIFFPADFSSAHVSTGKPPPPAQANFFSRIFCIFL